MTSALLHLQERLIALQDALHVVSVAATELPPYCGPHGNEAARDLKGKALDLYNRLHTEISYAQDNYPFVAQQLMPRYIRADAIVKSALRTISLSMWGIE